jgi:hypothetical protein
VTVFPGESVQIAVDISARAQGRGPDERRFGHGKQCAADFEREGATVTSTATIRTESRRPKSLERTQPKPTAIDARERESRVIRSAMRGSRSASFAGMDRLSRPSDAPFICG